MPITRPEIFITPDCPTVKFREDPKVINLVIEIPKILTQQGWALGTIFTVQFVNHEKTKLIKVARFIVSTENETLHTFNPDGERPMTKLIQARTAKQMEAWFYPDSQPVAAVGKEVKWNLGLGKHTVVQNGEIIFKGTRPEAEAFRDAA
jgi:hypothetical protein